MLIDINQEQIHEIRVALSTAVLSLEHYKIVEQTNEYNDRIVIIDNLLEQLPI